MLRSISDAKETHKRNPKQTTKAPHQRANAADAAAARKDKVREAGYAKDLIKKKLKKKKTGRK